MGFGTWNVRSLYRASSLKTTASELAKYNMSFEAFMAVMFQIEVFWVVMLCSAVVGY
jgi:hypothetical protein